MGPVIALLLLTSSPPAAAERLNGFDLSGMLVPRESVLRGGPPRDGIPALTDPKFVPAERSGLGPQDRVVGVKLGGAAKAYPLRILNWHEVVNDAVTGRRVVVTYCPLCGTAMVFDAQAGGRRRTFGVSGLLYNSDVLLYDRESESLWSHLMRKAVSGPAKGAELVQIPGRHTTWREWLQENPETTVLSFETGMPRDYGRDPYAGYGSNEAVFFPIGHSDRRLAAKEWILGLALDGKTKAYPLKDCPEKGIEDRVAGREISVRCKRADRSGYVLDKDGVELPSTQAYWFAWSAFHPDTELQGDPK
ncbi:DUF3179 domain-containing protein [bacterium]|nr:MAG: DUF3179 domain-containing protein [bacterium]